MKNIFYILIALLFAGTSAFAEGKHLFILSGQSNMQGHRPQEAFTPAVSKKFGSENVIVIQDALGGQPIQRWYKGWVSPTGEKPETTGDLYDRLISKVKPAIKGQKIATVTFFWMQGERDAKMLWGKVYEKSLKGLIKQLSNDLGRDDMNFVIGRLSDFVLKNQKYEHWTIVRDIQMKIGESSPRGTWIDTDDLNTGKSRKGKDYKDDLHMSVEGYKTMGKRFAEAAIKLIEKNK
ncbi:MAG: sialate O-acetylesterase [Lentisphaerales bacterium]|nr:sialate O-acetylesterase [Lentisphaerales bacterium]